MLQAAATLPNVHMRTLAQRAGGAGAAARRSPGGKAMRVALGLALLAMTGGCTSVRLAQRDGCWLRETRKWTGAVTEELGPCGRPAPEWVEDRFTRLVQECVAEGDHRWQNRAIAAWNRGDPLPERLPEETVLDRCSNEAARTVLAENELFKARIEDARERSAELVADRERLQAHNERLGDTLADTAKEVAMKPAGSAVATATAHGEGVSESRNDTSTDSRLASETQNGSSLSNAPPAPRPKGPTIRPGKATAKKPSPADRPRETPVAKKPSPPRAPAPDRKETSPAEKLPVTPAAASSAPEKSPEEASPAMSVPPGPASEGCECRCPKN